MDALLGAPEEAGTVGDEEAGIMLEETGTTEIAHEGVKTAGAVPEEIGTAESVLAEIGKPEKTECHTGFGDAEIPRGCGVCGKPL